MFKVGDKIHLHDGKVVRVRRRGALPKMKPNEHSVIRGFVRAALVDPDGTELPSDWHENVVTIEGHKMIVRNFVGIHSASTSGWATNINQLGLARYWGIGLQTQSTAQTSDMISLSSIQSEYGTNSNSTYGIGTRAAVTDDSGLQALSGTWSLTQTHQYAATHMTHGASVNVLAQHSHSSVSSGPTILSMATFASSTKGTAQALNVSYVWAFST